MALDTLNNRMQGAVAHALAGRSADRDLLRAIADRPEERDRPLLHRRVEGGTWADLARGVGGTPDGLRRLHARAVARDRRESSGAPGPGASRPSTP